MVSHLEIIHMNKDVSSGFNKSGFWSRSQPASAASWQDAVWHSTGVLLAAAEGHADFDTGAEDRRHLHRRWTILHTCDMVPLDLHPTEGKTSLRDTSWNLCALCAGLSWSSAPWTAGYQLWTLTTREGSSGTWMWAQDAWCPLASANLR